MGRAHALHGITPRDHPVSRSYPPSCKLTHLTRRRRSRYRFAAKRSPDRRDPSGVKHAPAADAARDCFCHLEVVGADERIGDERMARHVGALAIPFVANHAPRSALPDRWIVDYEQQRIDAPTRS